MALDIYYKRDILNSLRGLHMAGAGSASLMDEILADPELRGLPLEKLLQVYQRGFNTALVATGLSFGLVPEPGPQVEKGGQQKELERDFLTLLSEVIR